MSRGRDSAPLPASAPRDLDRVAAARDGHADVREHVEERAQVVARRALERDLAAGDGGRDDERAGLDAVGHDVVRRRRAGGAGPRPRWCPGAVRSTSAPICCRKHDQVVDLRLLGGRADGRVAVGQRRRQDGVLGAHHGHLREVDLGAAQPAGRAREVVAVAVVDVGAQGAHRVDVQVDRPAADAVAAGVADDHPPEARQQRPEQDEAGAHLGRGLERHEEPVDVARGDLVGVRRGMVDDDAEVAQHARP